MNTTNTPLTHPVASPFGIRTRASIITYARGTSHLIRTAVLKASSPLVRSTLLYIADARISRLRNDTARMRADFRLTGFKCAEVLTGMVRKAAVADSGGGPACW